MIEVSKLNGEKYYINCELIEMIEMIPDTLVTMTNGKTHYVLEPAEEVVTRIGIYKSGILAQAQLTGELLAAEQKAHHRRRQERMKEE